MACCAADQSQINIQISAQLVQNFQVAQAWTQIWILGVQTVSIDYYAIPATYSTDPGDAGDEVAQREMALCLAVQGWLHEVMNYMESWLIANFEEIALVASSVGSAAGAISGVLMFPVIVGFGIAAHIAMNAFLQLRNTEYREYLICRMLANLEGKDPDLRSDFEASLTADTIGRPQPEDFFKDQARDAIELYIRSQLNNLDNYLMFAGQLGTAMDIARSGYSDCPCFGFVHEFDFEVSDWGWTTMAENNRPHGVYQAGVGWVSEYELEGETDPPQAERLYVQIADFDSRVLTEVVAEWVVNDGSVAGRNCVVRILLVDALQDSNTDANWPQPGTVINQWLGSETSDEIEVIMVDGWPGATDGREYILKKVTVTGEGTDPF